LVPCARRNRSASQPHTHQRFAAFVEQHPRPPFAAPLPHTANYSPKAASAPDEGPNDAPDEEIPASREALQARRTHTVQEVADTIFRRLRELCPHAATEDLAEFATMMGQPIPNELRRRTVDN
jgi:hypothetical protein